MTNGSLSQLSRWPVVALGALAVLGCGSDDGKAVVTGVVTVDGKLVESGSIAFSPVDGRGASAGGKIVAGRYETRLVSGPAKVAIRVPRVVGQRKLYDTPDSPVQQVLEEMLPARYNDTTELLIDVQPDDPEHNFDLTSN